jgi:peptidyl-prolyl cis-trans isomerase SurA
MMKKLLFTLIIFFSLLSVNAYSFENKIILKVDNEIVTSIYILNESNYIKAVNENFRNLDQNELWKISLKSITREKIKKIELLNNLEKIEIDDDNFNKIITSVYKRFGFSSLKDFRSHLNSFNVNYDTFKKKVSIETLWNELIYSKFYNKIYIDKEKLKKEIQDNNTKKIKSFLLSEIVFDTSDNQTLDSKYELIKKDINERSFKKAALTYSISDTANSGGNLGWVNEDVINEKLKNEIVNLKIGEFSKPIIVPGGALILKIENIKEINNEINLEKKLNELIRYSTNEQLDQFSNIYFNKVKKNIKINEL